MPRWVSFFTDSYILSLLYRTCSPGPRICGGMEAAPPGSEKLRRLRDLIGLIFLPYQPNPRDCILFNARKFHLDYDLTLWKFDVRMLWVRAFDQRSRILNFFLAPRACWISGSLQKHVFTVSLGHARVCLIKAHKKRHKIHKFAKIMQFTLFCRDFDLVAKYAFSQAPSCANFSQPGSASDSRTGG